MLAAESEKLTLGHRPDLMHWRKEISCLFNTDSISRAVTGHHPPPVHLLAGHDSVDYYYHISLRVGGNGGFSLLYIPAVI